MTVNEVLNHFKITKPTEVKWRRLGILPEPVKVGSRIYYNADLIKNITHPDNE